MNQVWLAFITGFTSGGVSCLAVQGGLLATAAGQSAVGENSLKRSSTLVVGTFILAKLISHFLLGLMLGYLGSVLLLTPKTLGLIQIFAGIFMIITAARIAEIHPVLRHFVIQPPRFAYRLMRRTAKSETVFAPAILGFMSIFMPCGVTQAMMAAAVASGNALAGGLIMAAFVAGTSPLFFLLGAFVVELLKKRAFVYIAAAIVAVFGIISVNGGLGASGSIYTLQNFYRAAINNDRMEDRKQSLEPKIVNGYQEVIVKVTNSGYSSDVSELKAGIPVRLTIVTDNVHSCARAFTIPEFNISKILPSTGREVIEFTPVKTGRLAYSCSMGMYTGEFMIK